MASIVTDQFRILNASNFIDSVAESNNSYYVFLGLSNPAESKFGRSTGWDSSPDEPVDNLQYLSHYKDTLLFGKKITLVGGKWANDLSFLNGLIVDILSNFLVVKLFNNIYFERENITTQAEKIRKIQFRQKIRFK